MLLIVRVDLKERFMEKLRGNLKEENSWELFRI